MVKSADFYHFICQPLPQRSNQWQYYLMPALMREELLTPAQAVNLL
jgi:hypothetical protein